MLTEKIIVVFGMGPAGLFLARQLKKENKIVYGVGKKDDIGQYSNTLKRYFTTETIEGVKAAIDQIKKREKEKLGGYICSDQYLTMFLEKWPEIFGIIDISEPGIDTFQLIFDKEHLISYCQNIGMLFPHIFNPNDVKNKHVEFPIAAKPNIKRGHSSLKKVSVIENSIELNRYLKLLTVTGYKIEDILFQQYIHGYNRWEYGYGGYFENGVPITEVMFVQARQYPQGVSCYTIEISDKKLRHQIQQSVMPFIRATKYTGFLQFDLKQDAETKKIYVLDVNPRPWGSISILSRRYSKQSVFHKNAVDTLYYAWHFPLKELVSSRNKNNVNYSEFKRVKRSVVIDLLAWNDLKPFLAQPIIILKKLWIKWHKGGK